MIAFQFGLSGNDALRGPNESGIETFSGNKLESLVREQGQNSIDARSPDAGHAPVFVEYQLLELDASDVPGFHSLRAFLMRSAKFWKKFKPGDTKLIKFFESAQEVWKRSKVEILFIRDWNTTGLLGSKKTNEATPWVSLVRDEGVSAKPAGKGGSFGIGKNVFWLVSKARTVYFSTLDSEGVFAFRGKSLIPSWKEGEQTFTTPGFCGLGPKGGTVNQPADLHEQFVPVAVGTAIVVLAPDLGADWSQQVQTAFLKNFLVAIYEGILEVHLPDAVITAETLKGIVESARHLGNKDLAPTCSYWSVLTDSQTETFTQTFQHLGAVSLSLLKHPEGTKRVMMCRGTGMQIFELPVLKVLGEFSGVFRCNDAAGNEFLRGLENPAHNKWDEYERHSTPRVAKIVVNELYNWIKKTVREFMASQARDSIEIENFAEMLARVDVAETTQSQDQDIPERVVTITAPKVRPQPKVTQAVPVVTDVGAGEDEEVDDSSDAPRIKQPGPQSPPHRNRPLVPEGTNPAGKNLVVRELTSARIFRNPNSSSEYRLSLREEGVRAIFLYSLGDDGRRDGIDIDRATLSNDTSDISLIIESGDKIVIPSTAKIPALIDIRPRVSSTCTFLVFGEVENA